MMADEAPTARTIRNGGGVGGRALVGDAAFVLIEFSPLKPP